MSGVPEAAESVPFTSSFYRGVRSFIVSLVIVFVIGLALAGNPRLAGEYSTQLDIARNVVRFATVSLVAAQGSGILSAADTVLTAAGLLGDEGSVSPLIAFRVLLPLVPMFSVVFNGHNVAFGAGGPRLNRTTAMAYGASVAVGWVPLHVVTVFVWPRLGADLASSVLAVGGATVFSLVFGAIGGVLANR